jgi:hypothetical protein
MARTQMHLGAPDRPGQANAIRLPASAAIPPTVAESDEREDAEVPGFIGVDDGIRTHNNRNHNPGLYR